MHFDQHRLDDLGIARAKERAAMVGEADELRVAVRAGNGKIERFVVLRPSPGTLWQLWIPLDKETQ